MHVVADPRIVKRVIKRHRGLTGIGLGIPHSRCCVVDRKSLLGMCSEAELGAKANELEPTVVLVARPDGDDPHAVWRRAFHGCVHHALEERIAAGGLSEALVRERIHRIGQTEFDEVRSVLRAEELLFHGGDDRETYVELAAFFLELYYFDYESLDEFFPALHDADAVDAVRAVLARDLDPAELLARSRPDGAPDLPPRRAAAKVDSVAPPEAAAASSDATAPRATDARAAARDDEASRAQRRGNDVRAILVRMAAGQRADAEIEELAGRLRDAVGPSALATLEDWRAVVTSLATAAVRASSLRAAPARVLHDLQKACVDAERGRRAVDVVTWATSLFRRPIVRPLPTVRLVRIARHLHHARDASHHVRLAKLERRVLEDVLHRGIRCAEENVKREVKPVLDGVLDDVGLRPRSVPERVAREKLCEEILDRILARGALSLSHLRDALSQSSLKMTNLRARELLEGDALLRADALLAERLDGVYRRGEIYLRGLQKVSSVAFGTRPGRLVTLHGVLPLLASFVVLEGLQHVIHPLAKLLHRRHVHVLSVPSFVVTALFFYALLHAAPVRAATLTALRGLGSALHAVFVGAPRWALSRPLVRAVLKSRVFALTVKPLVLGGPAYLTARAIGVPVGAAASGAAFLVVVVAVFLSTPLGFRIEEAFTDAVLRRLRDLSRRVLPGLLALFVDVFRLLVEHVERLIYTVDEWLTFKDGQSGLSLVGKGCLGVAWFFSAYLLRIYVNLMIEPQVNPIKHFPVVTVSHKIILPLTPTILETLRAPLLPLGGFVANTIAGSTVFLLPGVFGFLVWELKANFALYRQNQSRRLDPVRIGHHGETMHALLVRGFHSGTIPKLFAKLRAATKRRQAKANAVRDQLRHVEHAVSVFVARELVGLLREASKWTAGDLAVHAVVVASNRVRVGVVCEGVSPDVTWLHFEEQSGLLVASVAGRGFLAALPQDQARIFEVALAGLYKRAGVDLVREQVAALVGGEVPYDVADEGLVVWPGPGHETEVVYDLSGSARLEGEVRGRPLGAPPPSLDAARLRFELQEIAWASWVDAWSEGERVRPIIDGPPLLD